MADDEWVDCERCGWGRIPGELCSNPDCEDSPNAVVAPDTKTPGANSGPALKIQPSRAQRRGNPTGKRGARVIYTNPVEVRHDGLTPEQRAERARNAREQDARRRAGLRKRRHEQRVARKRGRG